MILFSETLYLELCELLIADGHHGHVDAVAEGACTHGFWHKFLVDPDSGFRDIGGGPGEYHCGWNCLPRDSCVSLADWY